MKKRCLNCNRLLNPNGQNYSYQKYCSPRCSGVAHDKRRYKSRKSYLRIRSLEYYHRNKKKVIKKQIQYKKIRYANDSNFRKMDNIRKYTSRKVSLKEESCQLCNSNKDLQRHHLDYSKPLLIVILCRKCHNIVETRKRDLKSFN